MSYNAQEYANRQERLQQYADIANLISSSYGTTIAMLNQAVCLGEEAGEAQQAMRRFMGYARTLGELSKVAEELADVVITAYVAADLYAVNLDAEITAKLAKIRERGGK